MKKRYSQLDAIRLFAMFLICMTHILGHGGIISAGRGENNGKGYAIFLCSCLASCGIALFGILSGYLLCEHDIKLKKLQNTWLSIFAYSIGLQSIAILAWRTPFVSSIPFCFPILTGIYWYCSAYSLLYLALPMVNAAIAKAGRKSMEQWLLATLTILALYRLVPFFHHGYLSKLNLGHSPLILGYLYAIGAYLKKFDLPFTRKLTPLKELLCIAILLGVTWVPYWIRGNLQTNTIHTDFSQMLNGYTSPTILLCSVLIFHFISKLKFPLWSEGVLGLCSKSALSVYLIHDHPAIRAHFILDRFAFVHHLSNSSIVPAIFVLAICVLVVCLVFDIALRKVFGGLCRCWHPIFSIDR